MVGFTAPTILANPNGERRPILFSIRRAVGKEILSARAMVLLSSDLGHVWISSPVIFVAYRTDTRRTILDTIFLFCDTDVSCQTVYRVGAEAQHVP